MQYSVLTALLALAILACVAAVDRSKFRSCKDTGFCRVFREKSGPIFGDHYAVDKTSVQHHAGKLTAKITPPGGSVPLNLAVSFYASGSVRVKVSEAAPRWQPSDILVDDGSALAEYKLTTSLPASLASLDPASFLALGFSDKGVLALHLSPLRLELFRGDTLQLSLNERALLHFESGEGGVQSSEEDAEDRHRGREVVDYGEDGLALYKDGSKEEKKEHKEVSIKTEHIGGDNFGGHRDSMPRGPRSVGLDVGFPFAQHVYGLPEHATSLSLPTTASGAAGTSAQYSDPYRLYTLDVFEYEIGNPMALYGNIPLLLAHGKAEGRSMTAGMFWFNPSETFVDILDGGSAQHPYKQSRWLSESGEVDLFLLPGPDARSVYRQYGALTGTQQLPPLFALGYHQCRWNYRDERDVAAVEAMFEQLDFPVDVIWLDIEHTDGKRYFTWDKRLFPHPQEMQRNVSRHGRKMVTIVDPHIKRDDGYYINKEANSKGLYVKTKDGATFDGWCWPGSSSYLDFTSPAVRDWWAQQFRLDKYLGSTLDLFTWNDMNEPSVFNGPEVSMPKDAVNLQGVEHREWHNLYGIYMQMATALGLTVRSPGMTVASPPLRPFVLTRSFWAGSQRYGAMWTGDNTAEWSHLQIAAPMLLSINLGGLSFAGADVGGFFGEPDAELFTRWYQAGSFTPFFRGHAHLDTKRREPWVFGDPYTSILRSAAMLRYSLLPYWYSTFYEAYATGMPVMRPLFLEFPEDEITYTMDGQWMVGAALLVAPVTNRGQTSVHVYLPAGSAQAPVGFWYDLETLQQLTAGSREVQAPLDKLPVFVRGGSIVPRKLRLRRSAKLMRHDPYTLVVAPGAGGGAEGLLYLDDEETLAHEVAGSFALRQLRFAGGVLSCSAAEPLLGPSVRAVSVGTGTPQVTLASDFSSISTVERLLLAGQARAPTGATLRYTVGGESVTEQLSTTYDRGVVTVKKPDVLVTQDWTITLDY